MITMLCLLSTYTVLGGHYAWSESFPYKAQCLFDELIGNISGPPSYFLIADLTLLFLGYTMSMLSLFESTEALSDIWTFEKPVAALDQSIETLRRKRRQIKSDSFSPLTIYFDALLIVSRLVLKILRTLCTMINIGLSSRGVSLAFDLFHFSLGLYGIVSVRLRLISHTDGDENELAFGQIVPLLLPSSIILVFMESYEGWYHDLSATNTDDLAYQENRSSE